MLLKCFCILLNLEKQLRLEKHLPRAHWDTCMQGVLRLIIILILFLILILILLLILIYLAVNVILNYKCRLIKYYVYLVQLIILSLFKKYFVVRLFPLLLDISLD